MARRRVQRFNELLRQELSMLLVRRVRDPRLSSVTITEVDVTADLRIARVYVSIIDDDEKTQQEVLHSLHGAVGFLRRELARCIEVRHTPELIFHLDESTQYGQRIDELLAQIHQEEQSLPSPDEPSSPCLT